MNKLRPKAYSYLRFSTPEQLLGRSMRRQIEEAEVYARKELKLPIDERYADKGISGRKLRNATHGALGQFLMRVRNGEIAPGSVLIVENMNRLTRSEPLDAFDLLREIIKAGIEVVTLHDRRRYNAATMREVGPLIQALVLMSGSWQESENKSVWLADAWQKKRESAIQGRKPMTRQVPAWLRVVGVRAVGNRFDWSDARFEVIEDRRGLIREIFEKRVTGWGRRRIATWLNDRGIEPWGRGGRKAKGGWQESYIHKLLTSRAVLGEYQPHKLKEGRYSPRVPVGEVITGYYPQIVPVDLWHAAQRPHSMSPKKGRPSSSLISGLVIDPDGHPMHVERKGDGCDYVATARAFRRTGKPVHRWRLDHLEKCVMEIATAFIDWKAINRDDSRQSETRQLRGKLSELQREEEAIRSKLRRTAKFVLDGMGEFGEELKRQVESLNQHLNDVQLSIQETHGQLQLIEGLPAAADVLLRDLKGDLTNPDVRSRINAELRRLMTHIQVWPTGNCPRISKQIIAAERASVAERLTGNRGIGAKEHGRLVGAIEVVFPSNRRFASLWTYRPSARTDREPECLGAEPEDMTSAHVELHEKRRKR